MNILMYNDLPNEISAARVVFRGHNIEATHLQQEAEDLLLMNTNQVSPIWDVFITTLHTNQVDFRPTQQPGAVMALVAVMLGIRNVVIVKNQTHMLMHGLLEQMPQVTALPGTRIIQHCGQYAHVDKGTYQTLTREYLSSLEGQRNYPLIDYEEHQGAVLVNDWGTIL